MSDGGFGMDLGPAKLVTMLEERFGRFWGNAFLILVVLGISSLCIWAIAGFIISPSVKYIESIKLNGGITLFRISLDNIEIWITALFYLLVVLFVVIIVMLMRTRRRVSSKVLNRLARMLDEGNNNLLNRMVLTPTEYTKWKSDLYEWVEIVLDILKQKLSDSEYLLFKNLVSTLPKSFTHAMDPPHNQELVYLDWRLGRLRSIIDRYSA